MASPPPHIEISTCRSSNGADDLAVLGWYANKNANYRKRSRVRFDGW